MAQISKTSSEENLPSKPIQPQLNTSSPTIILTGTVFDLTTSSFGVGLTVAVCTETLVIIKSATVDSLGTYYISIFEDELQLQSNETANLKLCVFQKNKQLAIDQESETSSNVQVQQGQQKLAVLKVHSLPIIKGKVRRNNGAPASGILVELYKTGTSTVLESGFTDINGEYEIPYVKNADSLNASLFLKYYNNDDIIYDNTTSSDKVLELTKLKENEESVDYAHPEYYNSETNYKATRVKNYDKIHFIDDVVIEMDTIGKTYYYIITSVTKSGEQWSTNQKLIYLKDERASGSSVYARIEVVEEPSNVYLIFDTHISAKGSRNFWRIIEANGNYYKVLEQQISFGGNGTYRIVYSKADEVNNSESSEEYKKSPLNRKVLLQNSLSSVPKPGNEPAFDASSFKYIKEIQYFRASVSPKIYTKNRIETINFKFTRDSLDLYTRLTTREIECIEEEDFA